MPTYIAKITIDHGYRIARLFAVSPSSIEEREEKYFEAHPYSKDNGEIVTVPNECHADYYVELNYNQGYCISYTQGNEYPTIDDQPGMEYEGIWEEEDGNFIIMMVQ